jgi:hypothetical protein
MTEQEQPVEPQVETREIKSEKPPFDVNFFMQADQFSEYILRETPELQAVAIIPLWSVNLTGVPNGRIRLRSEMPSYAGQLFQVMQKLALFGIDVHRDLIAQIMAFDGASSNIARDIKAKKAELEELQKQIELTKSELDKR